MGQNGGIDTFINYGIITDNGSKKWAFYWSNGGYIRHIINYGIMGGIGGNRGGVSATTPMSVTNYGYMRGVSTNWGDADITIDNRGVIDVLWDGATHYHFAGNSNYFFILKNYAIVIQQDSNTFNTFTGKRPDDGDNSHLIFRDRDGGKIRFQDEKSKIILDFGSNFELGKEYSLNRLIMNDDYWNNWTTRLPVEFERLTTRSELYTLTQRGDNFIVNLADSKTVGYSTIGSLYKANIRTMNNFHTISNSMIYPHKFAKKRVVNRKRVRRIKRTAESSLRGSVADEAIHESYLDCHDSTLCVESRNDEWVALESLESIETIESLESLESNESFAYKSDSNNLSDLSDSTTYTNQSINPIRIANINERNQSTNQNNKNRPRVSTNRQAKSTIPSTQSNRKNRNTNQSINRRISQSHSTQNTSDNYYFILTPFLNHNYFFESGRYNLYGLEYGFITAFSGKLNNINALGLHFGFSYGSLIDNDTNQRKGDREFNITSMNLMLGLNYKLDLIWDMYIKARGDFFYFFNQIKSLTIFEKLKPNNLGFGLSVAYGKDFDFKEGGILGIEVALDYKALNTTSITLSNNGDKSINEVYNKALYNMLYVDLGLSYDKYFNTSIGKWGIDTGLGLKANVTNNALSTSKVIINNRDNIKMTIDNDLVLAYLNIAGSYVLESKNFDMEFSLAYYGSFGNRTMSNGGGMEWRVGW